MSDGHIYLIRLAASRSTSLSPHFLIFSPPTLPSPLPAIRHTPPTPHPHPHPLTPHAQANFRPPKGQRSRTTAARKKRAHTTLSLSLSLTHAHTAPFCRCRSTTTALPLRPFFLPSVLANTSNCTYNTTTSSNIRSSSIALSHPRHGLLRRGHTPLQPYPSISLRPKPREPTTLSSVLSAGHGVHQCLLSWNSEYSL
jgi:hypothetical protein